MRSLMTMSFDTKVGSIDGPSHWKQYEENLDECIQKNTWNSLQIMAGYWRWLRLRYIPKRSASGTRIEVT